MVTIAIRKYFLFALLAPIIGILVNESITAEQSERESNSQDSERWGIAGFDNRKQVDDMFQNIRKAAVAKSISPIIDYLWELPFNLNCEGNGSESQPDRFEISDYEQFSHIWRKLIMENERFASLRNLQFSDLRFNSYGARTPLGAIWFGPLLDTNNGREWLALYAINTFETCETLGEWAETAE